MFFSVGPSIDHRFVEHEKVGQWWFSHDAGWYRTETGWRKGYNHHSIDHGNYCEIAHRGQCIEINHDHYRSFPLWWDESTGTLTNLLGTGKQIWADDLIVLTPGGINSSKLDIYGDIEVDTLELDKVVDALYENLSRKIFSLKTDYACLSKNLFVSGGVDTLLLLAMSRQAGIDVNLIKEERVVYTRFLDINFNAIRKQHWGYQQINHWSQDCMLLSGAYGDEFMFRGPYSIGIWAAWHGVDMRFLLSQAHGYHVKYFTDEKNSLIFNESWKNRHTLKAQYPTKSQLVQHLLNINVNDHQHWHLEKTLTWTPFKDLELTKLILRLDEQHLLSHIVDATVTKKLIERFAPECLEFLSPNKNYQSRCNLFKLFGY